MKVLPPYPDELLSNYLPEETINSIFFKGQDQYQPVDVEKASIPFFHPSSPVQIKFVPIINHRNELAAVLAFHVDIVDLWENLGFDTVLSFLISWWSLSLPHPGCPLISLPIFKLSSSESDVPWDFDVRALWLAVPSSRY